MSLLVAVLVLVPASGPGQTTGAVSSSISDSPGSALREGRVLSLHTLPPDSVWETIAERIYRESLSKALGDRLDYNSERLDLYNFPDPSFESNLEDYLVRKYQSRGLDLLLASGLNAAVFAGRLQARLPGHPPIVFHGRVDERPVPKSAGYNFEFQFNKSLDLALRVHPRTRHVFVVSGAGEIDKWYDDVFRSQMSVLPHGMDVTRLQGLTLPALVERVGSLPPRSIVLLSSLTSDSEGREFSMQEAIERLAPASNAPIYTYSGGYMGLGVFGGRMVSPELVAEKTIALALRILRGERPEEIPLTTIDVSVDMLDWRQLDRWNVREASLPPGVELRFREPGLLDQHRGYILGALAVLLLQTALITGLLIQRRNRRLAESSLRESEERFRLMADTAPVMIWRAGPDLLCDFFNKSWLDFRGRSLREELGDGWTDGVHPEDLDRCLSVYRTAFSRREPFRMECRLRRFDGDYHWVLDSGVPRLGTGGTFLGYIGSCFDITERRHAEEALRANEAALRRSHSEIQDLAGRLITAQEQERARIARDLHDDVGQQLAAISITLSGCRRYPETQGRTELVEALTAAQRQTVELAEDIRLLSHDLHPGALMHAGLVDAVRSHCREFGDQHALRVEVETDEHLIVDDLAIALCLYRIIQEALRNIARHAEAHRVGVILQSIEDEVWLTVADDGKGFNLTKVREDGGGLGLRSIDERVRLVGGRLSIETAPRMGTTLTVLVKNVPSTVRDFAGV
jgi:PAS domain S-box-containing protein